MSTLYRSQKGENNPQGPGARRRPPGCRMTRAYFEICRDGCSKGSAGEDVGTMERRFSDPSALALSPTILT